MKRGDTCERREVRLMDKGANSTTTTINMWNQTSNSISADDEGVTISIHNAKVDVFKDFTSLTSTTGTKIERVCTLYALDTYATKHHLFVVSVAYMVF